MIEKNRIKKIKIAFLGSRGLPKRYGGAESFIQEIVSHLPKDIFEIYVSCESSLKKLRPEIASLLDNGGVQLVYFPVFEKFRIVSEVFYDVLSLLWASLKDLDIVYLCAYPAAFFCVFPRLAGKIVIINIDGLEWKRRKFSKVIRLILRICETISLHAPNYIVCDSRVIQQIHSNRSKIGSFYIAYPTKIKRPESFHGKILKEFGLKREKYYTVVCRMEPENNVDLIIEGFKRSRSSRKLVIIGPLENSKYAKKLFRIRSKETMILGSIYEEKVLDALRANCFAYIHGHEVGGTNPSLVEALGYGNAIIAFDVPFNREVAGDAAVYFKRSASDLAEKIQLVEHNAYLRETMRKNAYKRAEAIYSAEKIIGAYIKMFKTVMERKTRRNQN